MKKLLLPLLFALGCATSSLSMEKASENAKFVLDILQIDSVSLICKKDLIPDHMTCISIDKEHKTSILSCNTNECFIVNQEIVENIKEAFTKDSK